MTDKELLKRILDYCKGTGKYQLIEQTQKLDILESIVSEPNTLEKYEVVKETILKEKK